MSPPAPRRAYTLIEVLAALALLAVILPVALRSVSVATALGGQSRQRAEAATLARLKLDELAATAQWRQGDMGGDFAPDWPGYRWTAAVVDWDGSALRRLDVEVTWIGRGQERTIALSTLINSESP